MARAIDLDCLTYRDVRHVLSIIYLCMNCIHVLALSNLLLEPASGALNMDYKILHHNLDNGAYASRFARNLFYSRSNSASEDRISIN